MQMSDGNDEKAFRLDAIDESVLEAGNKGAAEMRSEWTAALRGGSQSLVCALHGCDEIKAQILRRACAGDATTTLTQGADTPAQSVEE